MLIHKVRWFMVKSWRYIDGNILVGNMQFDLVYSCFNRLIPCPAQGPTAPIKAGKKIRHAAALVSGTPALKVIQPTKL
jgi:hypothetical protein